MYWLAICYAFVWGQDEEDDQRLTGGLFDDIIEQPVAPDPTLFLMTPEASFVNMLRYGILALQVLPENANGGESLFCDGTNACIIINQMALSICTYGLYSKQGTLKHGLNMSLRAFILSSMFCSYLMTAVSYWMLVQMLSLQCFRYLRYHCDHWWHCGSAGCQSLWVSDGPAPSHQHQLLFHPAQSIVSDSRIPGTSPIPGSNEVHCHSHFWSLLPSPTQICKRSVAFIVTAWCAFIFGIWMHNYFICWQDESFLDSQMNIFHHAFLTWSFQKGLSQVGFGDQADFDDVEVTQDLVWTDRYVVCLILWFHRVYFASNRFFLIGWQSACIWWEWEAVDA